MGDLLAKGETQRVRQAVQAYTLIASNGTTYGASMEMWRVLNHGNARLSVQEPGIARFDVVQQADDPTRFVLVEVYRTDAAPAAHKETAHYAKWRDTVADMMAVPRQSTKFRNVFPEDAGW